MNISTRISILVASILILAIGSLLAFGYYGFTLVGDDADDNEYREAEVEKVKRALKNYVGIAYATIESNYRNSIDQDFLQKYYGGRLKSVIDVAESALQEKAEQVRAGKMSAADARAQAIEEIRGLRYDDGTGYIWINDTGKPFPRMVMHPTIPSLDGRILDDPSFNTALGQKKNLFVAFVEKCEASPDGSSFVDYLWPKPLPGGGLIPDVQKLSYVRLFPEWGWVLGTGIYVDDAITDGMQKSIDDLREMRYDDGVGYFWINDVTKPTPRMVMHPTVPGLDGKVLNDKKFDTTLGQFTDISPNRNLFEVMMERAEKQGDGFVDYLWPKPTPEGLTEDQPKMSYVKLFEPLGWIVGSGVYIDNIEKEIAQRDDKAGLGIREHAYELAGAAIVVILLASILAYWLVRGSLKNARVGEAGRLGPGGPVGDRGEIAAIAQEVGRAIMAEQTKLMAFTSVVHAARAGGNEEGMEVVAEVRDLTRRTNQAIEETRDLMDDVKKRLATGT